MKHVIVSMILLLALIAACTPQKPSTPPQQAPPSDTGTPEAEPQQPEIPLAQQAVKTFNVVAQQWSFSPSTIEVEKGDKVILKVTSADVEHGFSIPAFGVDVKVKKGETETVEFVADKVGTFTFACSVYCGTGHSTMKGILVVNEK